MIPTTQELFDLAHTLAAPILKQREYPWHALEDLKDFILKLGPTLSSDQYSEILPQVWVASDTSIAPSATIIGPCIIGQHCQVRPGAYIREHVLIGNGCVIGNSSEVKNSILFDQVQIPHFNYIGDSILGFKAHLGAGALTSNFKSDQSLVTIKGTASRETLDTGMQKLGAMIGDFVEIGCNCVLNPGAIVGRDTTIYPLSFVRGTIGAYQIMKQDGRLVEKRLQ